MAVNNFFDEQNRNLQLQHALMGMQGQYNQLVADRMQMGNFAMQEQRMQLANTLAMNEHLHMQGNNPAFHNRMPMPNNGPPMGPGTGSNPGAGFAPGPMPPAEGDWDRQQGRDRDNRRDRNGERRDRNYSSTRDDRGHDRGRRRESRGGSNNSSKSRYPRDDDRLSDEDIVSTNYPGTHDDEEGHSDRLSGHDGNGRDSDRSYARDRGYSRGRDRDYSRDRNRDRSRDRDRDYDRRDRDRDRDRDYSRERSKDASDYDDTSFQREKFVSSSPTNTILLKGLPSGFTELNVREEVKSRCQFEIKDVRVMKRHNAGMSRGFAFVELLSVDNARRWMDLYQGEFYLEDQTRITMYYGTARGVTTAAASARTFAPSAAHQKLNMMTKLDWICKKCSAHNFKRRDYCFKCSLSREESENLSSPTGEDQVGSNPCNTLLFRGLDALTTEETLSAAVQRESGIVPKNVLLMRDTVTGVSKCYGFSEMTSIKESDQFLSIVIAHPPFEVDGKGILVNYAKNTFSTIIATLDREYSDQQSSNRQASTTSAYQEQAQIPGYYYDHATNQYRDNATGLPYTPSKSDEPPSQNNAAAVAQAAIQRAHKQKHQLDSTDTNADTTRTTPTVSPENVPDGSGTYSYPVPDVSTYEYDATSTYYYDATTGLYYDANTQYYYNSHISKYLYWDGERQTYLLEPSQTGASNAAGTTEEDGESGNTEKKGKKKEKEVKVAKQIAKDMAKWAKSQNAKQEALADMKRAQHGNVKESASADAGFAMLERKTPAEERKLMPPPPMAAPAPSAAVDTGLVASYGGDSDDEEDPSGMEALDESKLVDWDKLACLLCKRQFPQKETLQKHLTKSGLHKKNLDELRKSTESEAQQRSIQYRDRAKERRAKYGAPAPPVSKRMSKRPEPQLIPEQPTKAGIGQDNIGNQLLQKMGWSEGSGLGRQGQGRVNPVEAKRRSATAGLGAQGANYDYDPSDTYKESAKKAMFARYKELE